MHHTSTHYKLCDYISFGIQCTRNTNYNWHKCSKEKVFMYCERIPTWLRCCVYQNDLWMVLNIQWLLQELIERTERDSIGRRDRLNGKSILLHWNILVWVQEMSTFNCLNVYSKQTFNVLTCFFDINTRLAAIYVTDFLRFSLSRSSSPNPIILLFDIRTQSSLKLIWLVYRCSNSC